MKMATLYVRDFPDELHRRIRDLAERHHRSMSAEVTILIDEALKNEDIYQKRAEILSMIAEKRKSYTAPTDAADSLDLLREDRAR